METRSRVIIDRDPDIAMSDIAYVKGAFFFRSLEAAVGRNKLDEFLNSYFQRFAFRTISAAQFIDYLNAQLLKPSGSKFNYRDWIYKPGLPSNCVKINAPRLAKISTYAMEFNAGKNPFQPKVKYKWIRKNGKRKKVKQTLQIQYKDHIIQEWQLLIRALSEQTKPARLKLLDRQMHFSQSNNSEILCDWFVLSAKTNYAFQIEKDIKRFLEKIGRRKYVLPIYEALASTPNGLKLARRIFHEAKNNYHSVTRTSVWRVLQEK